MTVHDAVHQCTAAAEEAMAETGSRAAAAVAFRSTVPRLESLDHCRAFVACIAEGMLLGYVSIREANVMMSAVVHWLQLNKLEVAA